MKYLTMDDAMNHMRSAVQDFMSALGTLFQPLYDAIIDAAGSILEILDAYEICLPISRCRWCARPLILTLSHVCSRCGGPPRTWTPEYVFAGQ